MQDYSVLMSVYSGEKPEYVDEAIKSMMAQTAVTNDFVIVCDGPLTDEIDLVLERYKNEYPDIFNIVRLPENVGIGAAAAKGILECKNELIAKMDADDISVPERCDLQLKRFEEKPEIAVLGGFIEEFDSDPNTTGMRREVPESYEGIIKFSKRRQPFNNNTVMYRKSAVLKVGGYKDLRRCEDYELYTRLIGNGFYMENLGVTLVKMRMNSTAKSRRVSKETLKGYIKSRSLAYKAGYISLFDFLFCCFAEFFICFCPVKIQRAIYDKFLRKKVVKE